MKAESAPSVPSTTPDDEKARRRHGMHAAPNPVESETEQKNIMVGFNPEVRRDKAAIQEFIRVRDYYFSKGYPLDDSILKAADEYERTVGSPLQNWGLVIAEPETPKAPEDPNPANTTEVLTLGSTLPEIKPEFPTKYAKVIEEDEARQIREVRELYAGERGAALKEKNKELENVRNGFKSFHNSKTQKAVAIKDSDALKLKEQLDYLTPAIEAASKARVAALEAGKSVLEAEAIGAAEYTTALTESGVNVGTIEPEPIKTTAAGRREASAIQAFNEQRDTFVSGDQRNVKYSRAKALHEAVGKYVETLEHVEHMGHSNPDSIYADGHDDEHDEHPNDTPPPVDLTEPTTAETEKKTLRKKIRETFGKVGSVITRERQVAKATGTQDYLASLVESFKIMQEQKSTERKEAKADPDYVKRYKRILPFSREKFDTTWLGKRHTAAQIRKDQRLAAMAEDIKRRVNTVQEHNLVIDWRLDGQNFVKDVRQFTLDRARAKIRAESEAYVEDRARTKAAEKSRAIEDSDEENVS